MLPYSAPCTWDAAALPELISVYPQNIPVPDRLLAAKLSHYGFVP
jgi:hypothetical protein